MTKFSSVLGCLALITSQGIAAQTTGTQPQIDNTWLTVDSASKTATFQLTSGLTQLNGGLNFNGFNDGKLTLSVPTGWNVVVRFKNQDPNLTHSAEVVDTAKPMPAGTRPNFSALIKPARYCRKFSTASTCYWRPACRAKRRRDWLRPAIRACRQCGPLCTRPP